MWNRRIDIIVDKVSLFTFSNYSCNGNLSWTGINLVGDMSLYHVRDW